MRLELDMQSNFPYTGTFGKKSQIYFLIELLMQRSLYLIGSSVIDSIGSYNYFWSCSDHVHKMILKRRWLIDTLKTLAIIYYSSKYHSSSKFK